MRSELFTKNGYYRVWYAVYRDQSDYEHEQQRVFRSRTSLFRGLEAEIPNGGDFQISCLGDTPLVYNRDPDSAAHAFINRCAHRGAIEL